MYNHYMHIIIFLIVMWIIWKIISTYTNIIILLILMYIIWKIIDKIYRDRRYAAHIAENKKEKERKKNEYYERLKESIISGKKFHDGYPIEEQIRLWNDYHEEESKKIKYN